MSKKILIMEDEKILQSILIKKLSESGFEVSAVDDGLAGVNSIKDGNIPDLILLDVLMPHMDGFDVLEMLKHDKKYSSIPVIIISNSGQPVEIKRALLLGVIDYLVKVDFSPSEVLEKVNKYFENQKKVDNEIEKKEEEELKPAGIRVLLVEDDDFLRDICEIKLKKEGFDVTTSADGLDAFKKIREIKPQLVLLDVILPGMDGFDILKQTKENKETALIPIIMLTNLGQNDEVQKGFDLGAEDYIIKAHFTVGEIVEKVRGIIKKLDIK